MNSPWKFKNCIFCGDKIPYLPKWINRPDKCNKCKIMDIPDIKMLFRGYLNGKQMTELREKVLLILRECAIKKIDIYDACKQDRELMKLAIALHKEQSGGVRRQSSSVFVGKNDNTYKSKSSVQGGAPSLGKRK